MLVTQQSRVRSDAAVMPMLWLVPVTGGTIPGEAGDPQANVQGDSWRQQARCTCRSGDTGACGFIWALGTRDLISPKQTAKGLCCGAHTACESESCDHVPGGEMCSYASNGLWLCPCAYGCHGWAVCALIFHMLAAVLAAPGWEYARGMGGRIAIRYHWLRKNAR